MFHEAYKTGDDALFAQFPDDLLELTEHQQTLVRHGGVGGGILTLYPQCWGVCVCGEVPAIQRRSGQHVALSQRYHSACVHTNIVTRVNVGIYTMPETKCILSTLIQINRKPSWLGW